ncbi:tyrosine-type recombinase/integrase [Thermodesulfobacteriota bacterium]
MPRKITQRLVKSYHTKLTNKVTHIRDTYTKGFGCRCSRNGDVAFYAEGRIRGKGGSPVRLTIGKFPTYTVEEAREKAKELLQKLSEGIDPRKEKARQLAKEDEIERLTLSAVYQKFKHQRDLKPGTIVDYDQVMKNVYGDWMGLPIASISRKMVEDRFFEYNTRSKAVSAKGTRVLSSICTFAKAIELSDDSRILTENPVDILRELKVRRTIPRRQTRIPPEDMTQILGRLRHDLEWGDRPKVSRSVVRAIYVLALTGTRKAEILKLKKADIQLQSKIPHIIIEDTKNREAHHIPITDNLLAVIHEALQDNPSSEWLFPQRTNPDKPLNNPNKAVSIYLMSSLHVGVSYTLHDFRRTFISVADEIGIDHSWIKQLVNHKTGDVTAGYIIPDPLKKLSRAKDLMNRIHEEMHNWKYYPTYTEEGLKYKDYSSQEAAEIKTPKDWYYQI